MKKIISLILIIFSCLCITSCAEEEPNNEATLVEKLPYLATEFIESINSIQTVTLESKDRINACIILYTCIEETAFELLENDDVIEAKNKLDNYISQYNALKIADIENNKNESLVNAFVDAVAVLPSIDSITIEDLSKILIAENNYKILSEDLKQNSFVIEAKVKLDAIRSEYNAIATLDTEAYNARKFVLGVEALPTVDELTIEDLGIIDSLYALYDSLLEEHINSENVVAAKTKIDLYENKVMVLKTAQQNATDFIMAVFSLPTGSALKYQNVEQRAEIEAAFGKYNKLTDFEKAIIGVSDAYSELNTIKNQFEALKEPYDISKIEPTHLCLYYYDGPKKLTFVNGKDPRSVLISDYGLTEESIKDNVIIYLDVYIEGGAVKGNPLFSFDITECYDVTVQNIVDKLYELKNNGNESITSQGYTFTIHIESLNDQYGDSEYSNFFSSTGIPIE